MPLDPHYQIATEMTIAGVDPVIENLPYETRRENACRFHTAGLNRDYLAQFYGVPTDEIVRIHEEKKETNYTPDEKEDEEEEKDIPLFAQNEDGEWVAAEPPAPAETLGNEV